MINTIKYSLESDSKSALITVKLPEDIFSKHKDKCNLCNCTWAAEKYPRLREVSVVMHFLLGAFSKYLSYSQALLNFTADNHNNFWLHNWSDCEGVTNQTYISMSLATLEFVCVCWSLNVSFCSNNNKGMYQQTCLNMKLAQN